MIIDIHSHLGDILYPNGGESIFRQGVADYSAVDAITLAEAELYRNVEQLQNETEPDDLMDLLGEASQARSRTATLENFDLSLEGTDIVKTACMPIPPYVTFEDLRMANEKDARVIPFTGIDFTCENDIDSGLADDVSKGAKGLKLHPIIQKMPLHSKRVYEAVEAFSPHGLPVLCHCGSSSYYVGEEKVSRQTIDFGDISHARELVSRFPKVPFILGHAGLLEVDAVMELLGGFKNVWVDISFQTPEKIRELIHTFGPEKILFASDWPWGSRTTPIKTVTEACRGDIRLEGLIFYENAAHLLKIE